MSSGAKIPQGADFVYREPSVHALFYMAWREGGAMANSAKGLVTNYGEGPAKQEGGGASEVYPYRKWGHKKLLPCLRGGTKSFELVLTQELEVLAIVMGRGVYKVSNL